MNSKIRVLEGLKYVSVIRYLKLFRVDTCFVLHITQDIKLEPPRKQLGVFVQN
jgi:hypothetical protein